MAEKAFAKVLDAEKAAQAILKEADTEIERLSEVNTKIIIQKQEEYNKLFAEKQKEFEVDTKEKYKKKEKELAQELASSKNMLTMKYERNRQNVIDSIVKEVLIKYGNR